MENNWIDSRLAALDANPSWIADMNRGLALLRERQNRRRSQARVWTWCGAAATAVLCLIAFPAPRAAAQYCLDCSVALWQNLAAPKLAHAILIPENSRKPAPSFLLNDATGKQIGLADYKGRVVLLNFWATWCGGCRVEIPWLIEFERAYASRGLAVLGVSLDDAGWRAVNPYAAEKGINYPVTLADSRVSAAFGGISALPMTFVIDQRGRIASTHRGVVSKADYQAEIERLLHE
jgi:peroxiredoxin